jgi:hypothetical protein
MSHVATAPSFKVPYYVCRMQRRQDDHEAVFYGGEYQLRDITKMLELAATHAPLTVVPVLLEVERRVTAVAPYDRVTIDAAEFGQTMIDDIRALHDWVDAIGAGTVDDPDNVMCLPNRNRIGRPGHCKFCGTPGGRGGCCD